MPTLHFKGKPLVQNHHLVVPFSELEAVKSRGLSKMPSLPDNLIVEGDNLKALKALLPACHGKVKCIYIDPPYNTGNEGWIYNDRVNSPMMRDWLGRTVDRDDLTRHDKWCCMMLPRLKLLRELLTDDGAIFVSIDDNEVHHLRALMDEVFGEENFVANLVWEKGKKGDAKLIASVHEHVLIYVRNKERLTAQGIKWRTRKPGLDQVLARHEELKAEKGGDHTAIRVAMMAWFRALPKGSAAKSHKHYNWSDDRGLYFAADFAGPDDGRENRPRHDIIHPITKKPCAKPSTGWRWDEETTRAALLEKPRRIHFGPDETTIPNRKTYLKEVTEEPTSSVFYQDGRTATLLLEAILGKKAAETMPFPKDVEVLSGLFALVTDKDSTILDSFAGSGTTAHAVLALNKEDGGNRRFILCQMPYETKEQEQNKENICESITAERVRRVIKGVPGAKDEVLRAGLGGTFSYFRLGRELRKQAILDGKDLPSFEALAGYVFFTATGEEFQPKKIKPPFIGTSRDRDVFLIYEQDVEKLKDMALNLDLARSIAKRSERRKLVFAPTKYLDQDYLDRLGIEFCQLPFEIYQRAQGK